jgi:hypothetical protein
VSDPCRRGAAQALRRRSRFGSNVCQSAAEERAGRAIERITISQLRSDYPESSVAIQGRSGRRTIRASHPGSQLAILLRLAARRALPSVQSNRNRIAGSTLALL